ncbi:hypothetical protein GOP47_0021399 [Adiantum capillus-veneris]|uniref:Uncharacterized protein n=1 Tax=Adiantum capillus-veneris TaxID=13818 RepID=A0A9D4U7N6_ADICA|nr:hypothetical protein GOP47_0021399 [Adiantum capillus-veneris]
MLLQESLVLFLEQRRRCDNLQDRTRKACRRRAPEAFACDAEAGERRGTGGALAFETGHKRARGRADTVKHRIYKQISRGTVAGRLAFSVRPCPSADDRLRSNSAEAR